MAFSSRLIPVELNRLQLLITLLELTIQVVPVNYPDLTDGVLGGRRDKTNQDIGQGLTAGIGYKFGRICLDYAYVPYGDLGDTHRISLGMKF